MRSTWSFLLLCVVLAPACGGGGGGSGAPPVAFTGVGVAATPDVGNGAVPNVLSPQFQLGIANFDEAWPNGSGVVFGYRSQYLSNGVNTGAGWTTWNSPPGQFAVYYMNNTPTGTIPVFNYYQLRGSAPNIGSEDPDSKLQNPGTMNAYYAEFKLLMQKCAAFGKPVIVHVEPDFWGFCQAKHGSLPETIPVCVANTGFPEAVGLNDNLCGFAQLLVKLRDTYVPKVAGKQNTLIALHASHWGSGADLIKNQVDPVTQADAIGGFFTKLGAKFDLMFHDPSDRDAGYYQYYPNVGSGDGGASWWAIPADFDRYRSYLSRMKTVTGRRNILWQVPYGNTKTVTCDNTFHHYQDNRVEYWLDDAAPHANITAYAGAGVIGIIWGGPQDGTTQYDTDGDYFRTKASAYYSSPITNP